MTMMQRAQDKPEIGDDGRASDLERHEECEVISSAWGKRHEVVQLNGRHERIRQIARFQIVREDEHVDTVICVPYLVYMPENDTLLMLVNNHTAVGIGEVPRNRAFVLASKDHGATWREWGCGIMPIEEKPGTLFVGLTYLGKGKLLLYTESEEGTGYRCDDWGQHWSPFSVFPRHADGRPWHSWDPLLPDKDPDTGKVTRLWQAGHGGLRFSTDLAQTWSPETVIPQWGSKAFFVSEIHLSRARNGDMIAACRVVEPELVAVNDHGGGLGTSVSRDDGNTWSPMNRLYLYGRHHPSMVLMPNGHIVMSHVVRRGYVPTVDGFMQFGVEAVISRDNGQTWDLDHKYVLAVWKAAYNDRRTIHEGSQSTSTVRMPDGSLMTAFGTGYRFKEAGPGDIGLVQWRLNEQELNDDDSIASSPLRSDERNVWDPTVFNYAVTSPYEE